MNLRSIKPRRSVWFPGAVLRNEQARVGVEDQRQVAVEPGGIAAISGDPVGWRVRICSMVSGFRICASPSRPRFRYIVIKRAISAADVATLPAGYALTNLYPLAGFEATA